MNAGKFFKKLLLQISKGTTSLWNSVIKCIWRQELATFKTKKKPTSSACFFLILRKNETIQNQCILYFKDQKFYFFFLNDQGLPQRALLIDAHVFNSVVSSSFHDPIFFWRRNTLSKGTFLTCRFCPLQNLFSLFSSCSAVLICGVPAE